MAASGLTATTASSSRINLSWTRDPECTLQLVYRGTSSGGETYLANPGILATSYQDNSVEDGTKYYYKIRSTYEPGVYEWSNEANATTLLPAPSGLSGYSNAGGTEAVLSWTDNSQNEASFKVYKNGSLIYTTAANATGYTATGLTPGATYSFYIKAYNATAGYSPASNTLYLTMADPPAKPSDLTATPTATTKVRLNWTDNSDNEVDFHIEKSSTSATAGFSEVTTVGANVTTYEVTSLTSNTQYWFRVRAHNASGYSAYCTVATAVTLAAIAAPTNLTLTAAKVGGSYGVEVLFTDNSELEDYHIIERKESGGSYSVLVSLPPNQTYYHDATVSAGATYYYRVRAKQGASSYSSYSDEMSIAVSDVPSTPGSFAVAEYQDTTVRLTWVAVSGTVGYIIYQSDDDGSNYTEIVRIPHAAVTGITVYGLTASTHYHWGIRAYNAKGSSSMMGDVSQTTRAAYLPSKFEKLIRRAKPRLMFLVEANPLMELTGWALSSSQTYTYEAAFDERGAELDAVYENGIVLTEKTSIATVEGTAGTWWHDTATGKVYVHTLAGDDPINYTLTGSFWLYFSYGREGDIVYNGHPYLPLVASGGIPDISQEIQPYYEGTLQVASGEVSLINGKLNKEFYFDKRFARYLWLNRKVKLLAGGESFSYSEFRTVNTGIVNAVTIEDKRLSLELRDYRDGLQMELPPEKFTIAEFPLMNEDNDGKERAFAFGAVVDAVPTCIDETNRVFEFNHGRVKSVSLTQNGTTLTENTHYFVDNQRGRLTLARGLSYATSDILLVSFTGCVNEAEEATANGAEIFLYICLNYLGLTIADMDLDAIYRTKTEKATSLSLSLRKAQSSDDIFRTIEQSIQSYTLQDAEGRLGIRAEKSAADSGAPYVWDCHVFDFLSRRTTDHIYSAVNVYYGEDREDKFSLAQTPLPAMTWRYGVNKALDLYTALASSSDAAALGAAIAGMMERRHIEFTVPRVLYNCLPGDVIYFTRTRFPSLSGTAANLPVRILGVSKQISAGRTSIIGEVVE